MPPTASWHPSTAVDDPFPAGRKAASGGGRGSRDDSDGPHSRACWFASGGDPLPAAAAAHGDHRAEDPGYRIGPEDVLQVSVWENEAMSRTAPVRPDGEISLPLLNDIQAAGLTPMELRDELMRRLVEYMPHPEVAVSRDRR